MQSAVILTPIHPNELAEIAKASCAEIKQMMMQTLQDTPDSPDEMVGNCYASLNMALIKLAQMGGTCDYVIELEEEDEDLDEEASIIFETQEGEG